MDEIEIYKILTKFREPLIRKIIDSLHIKAGSYGADIGCGIGHITNLLAGKTGSEGKLTGMDFSENSIRYAKEHSKHKNIEFVQGDVNEMQFEPESFDWIWSMDTVWVGPEEYGCPAKSPDKILEQFYNILKPGGKLYLVYWTSQKLLPGYPLLEARLNATTVANAPFTQTMNPDDHVLNVTKWLIRTNFKATGIKTFAGDITAPLDEETKTALTIFFQMFWENSREEVTEEDWAKYKALCSPGTDEFILNNPGYYGFYTYTLFEGTKD